MENKWAGQPPSSGSAVHYEDTSNTWLWLQLGAELMANECLTLGYICTLYITSLQTKLCQRFNFKLAFKRSVKVSTDSLITPLICNMWECIYLSVSTCRFGPKCCTFPLWAGSLNCQTFFVCSFSIFVVGSVPFDYWFLRICHSFSFASQ